MPLDLIGNVDWSGKLAIGQLLYDGATFDERDNSIDNAVGRNRRDNRFAEVLRRQRNDRIDDRRHRESAAVESRAEAEQVDSKALLAWLDEDYDWVAFFLAGGELNMRGNSERELIASLTGTLSFDGGEGSSESRKSRMRRSRSRAASAARTGSTHGRIALRTNTSPATGTPTARITRSTSRSTT